MGLTSPAPLDTYQALVSAFTEFLTVAIHLILYERDIYPRESFLRARKYDFPVQQNRHPRVCKWITDAVAAVGAEMLKCTVRQTSVVIYSPASVPLERYVFCTDAFPLVRKNEILVPFESEQHELQRNNSPSDSRPTTPTPATSGNHLPSMIELTAQFSAVLSRLNTQCAGLETLPHGCSFTVAIELRDAPAGQLPLDNQITWIPSEPGLQPDTKRKGKMHAPSEPGEGPSAKHHKSQRQDRGMYLGGQSSVAVRAVEAGQFIMEVWIEENKASASRPSPAEGQKSNGDATPSSSLSQTALHAYVEDVNE